MKIIEQIQNSANENRKKWLKAEVIKGIIDSGAYEKLAKAIPLKSGMESFVYIDLRAEIAGFFYGFT